MFFELPVLPCVVLDGTGVDVATEVGVVMASVNIEMRDVEVEVSSENTEDNVDS